MKKLLLKSTLLLCALIAGSLEGWAVNQTLTLTQSALGLTGSYTTGTEKTVGDITFVYTDLMKNNDNIQAKANSGTIYNKTAFPTKILSVAITHSGTARPTTISGSSDGANWTQVTTGNGSITGDFSSKNYKYFKITRGSNAAYWENIVITYEEAAAAGTTEVPTISGETPFYGSTTVTITNAASAEGAAIYYTLNGVDPTTTTSATCFEYTAPFEISATTTVKAIAKKSTDTNASSVVTETFTKVIPMTVDEALAAINALADNGTIDAQYVTGVVSAAGTVNNGTITYSISADGTTANQLQVYKGKNLNNTDFADNSDIQVGDVVVVFGQLKKYKSGENITPEFNSGNYLISLTRKPAPTFSLDKTEATLESYTHETVDVSLTTNTDGEITCESSNPDVATVALKSAGIYTITAQMEGTATITIKSALSANYAPAQATVAVTVNDSRAAAEISFDDDEIEKTWGDAFTGQALTNTHSLPVTWSSTDEAVANVDESGEVTVLKAGTTTIKATFAGNATYKNAVASYTLTIKKAAAGLSYEQTSFEIMLNDASFVTPTLINPNNLTVTYASNNTDVAIVDENTGELVYDETAAGTAKITATFAGNDNYYSGSANYTITIVDPTVKGSKYNPYTVAEVINGTATGTGIYVTGFIVGEYKSNDDPITSNFTTDANIAIADEYSDSPKKATSIPVNLTVTAHRNAWGNETNNGKTLGYKILIKGNKNTYFGVNGIKNVTEVSAVSAPVTVSAAGLATFANDYALDFTNVENLEAYIAKEESGAIKLHKVNKVPAGTGVLLRAKNGATDFEVPVATTADDVTDNLFVRGTGAAVESGSGPYNYVLGKHNGEVGFYKAGGMTVAKDKAYLQTTISSAHIFIDFENMGVTGVNEITNTNLTNNTNEVFDLQGRKVANPSKGLYIVNGHKVIVK